MCLELKEINETTILLSKAGVNVNELKVNDTNNHKS